MYTAVLMIKTSPNTGTGKFVINTITDQTFTYEGYLLKAMQRREKF